MESNDLTSYDVPVEQVLDAAKKCQQVLVLGYDKEGEFYAASSTGDGEIYQELIEMFVDRLGLYEEHE